MRTIESDDIVKSVKELCKEANYHLPLDVKKALYQAIEDEDSELSKETLKVLKENAEIASNTLSPICQDTGMACIFIELCQEVHF